MSPRNRPSKTCANVINSRSVRNRGRWKAKSSIIERRGRDLNSGAKTNQTGRQNSVPDDFLSRKSMCETASRPPQCKRINIPTNPTLPPPSRLGRRNRRRVLLQFLVVNGRVHLPAVDGDFLLGLYPPAALVAANLPHPHHHPIRHHESLLLLA